MKAGGAAQRYAKALFGLAQDDRRHREVRAELARLRAIFAASREVSAALLTPMHPAAERKAALKALAVRENVGPLVQNFLGFLVDQRRLIQFEAIALAYDALADQAEGMLTAEVKVASPLDDRRKDRLRRALSDRTGREVKLQIEVDPSLIGGAIAKVGDLVFDGSLRTQLSQLRANLTHS
ncbi:MAG: F0F1 ATP synthase subunit delta [Myxococcota bacterium]